MLQLVRKYAGMIPSRRARAKAKSFLDGASRAREVQEGLLVDLVRRHAESQFGRDHGFAEIRSFDDYRRRVPIRGYDGHEPYIAKVRNGDLSALFGPGTEVLMFAKTSGTTATPKTIPVTRETLRAYKDGWTIWGIMAFDAHPGMIENGLRPILQFASDWRESFTASGIPCGAITGLTAQMQMPLVRLQYCMTPDTARIKDIESKYYMALRLSIYRELGTIIAANPGTIRAIARIGERESETLLRDIRNGTVDPKWAVSDEIRKRLRFRTARRRRAAYKRLEGLVGRTGGFRPKDYWPNLEFLACWMGGTMGAYVPELAPWFGEKPVRDPGLIASEGRMTIPIADGTPSGLLDYAHHVFEFIPEDQADAEQPETVLAADLVEGRRYFLLMTTAGGLYRYNIFDLVECTGFHGQAPLIRFLNKGAHFSSVAGEKLSEFQAVQAVHAAQRELGARWSTFLLLPEWGSPPRYVLLIEEQDLPAGIPGDRIAEAVDRALGESNEEYLNRRETQRLGPVALRVLPGGSWADYQRRRLEKSGGTLEQYKKPCLIPDLEAIGQFATK